MVNHKNAKKTGEKIKIDTLIISDIHLGNKNARSSEVMAVLEKYDFSKLILNGDILNGLHFQRMGTEQWRVLSKFRKLTKHSEVIWVHGNHDASSDILSRLLGIKVYNKIIWEAAGKKYLAIHGHQFDRFLHKNFLLSYLAFSIYYLIKQVDKSGALINFIKNHNGTWQRNSLDVAKGAIKLGRNLGADYVFCGHTHMIYETENNGIKYYNTGSWVEKPSAYIIINGDKIVFNKEI